MGKSIKYARKSHIFEEDVWFSTGIFPFLWHDPPALKDISAEFGQKDHGGDLKQSPSFEAENPGT
jgi:hypothetical protein